MLFKLKIGIFLEHAGSLFELADGIFAMQGSFISVTSTTHPCQQHWASVTILAGYRHFINIISRRPGKWITTLSTYQHWVEWQVPEKRQRTSSAGISTILEASFIPRTGCNFRKHPAPCFSFALSNIATSVLVFKQSKGWFYSILFSWSRIY